uniref:Uncharacterized protein n=1 Tax=Oryza glumipatula TaxID=40148 RepID=A0A0E0BR19_9ORYZ
MPRPSGEGSGIIGQRRFREIHDTQQQLGATTLDLLILCTGGHRMPWLPPTACHCCALPLCVG